MRKVLVIQRGCIAAYSVICNTLNCLQLEGVYKMSVEKTDRNQDKSEINKDT